MQKTKGKAWPETARDCIIMRLIFEIYRNDPPKFIEFAKKLDVKQHRILYNILEIYNG